MAVVGVKRGFTMSADCSKDLSHEYQTKRICVHLDPKLDKQRTACNQWNTMEMECQSYTTRPDRLEGCPATVEMSSPLSLNNNKPISNNNNYTLSQYSQGQSICLRCQAGEPGHIQHILH